MLAVLISATAIAAAPADEFYDGAFRQGVAAFDAGTYDVALARLRIAAFGYIDDAPRYETAEAYLAVAARRAGRMDEAKRALLRIVAAERIARNFAALQLPKSVRDGVEEAAKALLTAPQAALLTAPAPAPQPQQAQPTVQPPAPNGVTNAP